MRVSSARTAGDGLASGPPTAGAGRCWVQTRASRRPQRVERPVFGEQPHAPDAQVLVGRLEQWEQEGLVGAADRVERPERAELPRHVGLARELVAEQLLRVANTAAVHHAVGELDAGLSREPLVGVRVERDELLDGEARHVAPSARLGVAVGDLVDAAAQTVLASAVVIVAGVAPVGDEDAAVRTVADVDAAIPRVDHVEDVRLGRAPGQEAGPAALEGLDVGPVTEEVQQVDAVAVFGRPVVALINHHADDRSGRWSMGRRPRTHRRVGLPQAVRRLPQPRPRDRRLLDLRRLRPGPRRHHEAQPRAARRDQDRPRRRRRLPCHRVRLRRHRRDPAGLRGHRPPPSSAPAATATATAGADDRVHRRAAGKPVIRDVVDQFVRLQVRLGRRADELRAGHLVPEVADDGRVEEVLAVLVPVLAPGIDRAGAQHLDDLRHGVIPEDRSANQRALRLWRAGRAEHVHVAVTHAAVDPAVDAEPQTVRARVLVGAGGREAVEHHLRGTVRHAVGIAVRDEEHLRRGDHPDAAVADREPHQVLDLVGEDPPGLEPGAAVGIVEDDDPVEERVDEPIAVHRVVLGDPQPAVRIPGDLNGILHVGLGREDAGLETGRELHLGDRLGGRLRRRAGAAGHGIGVEI